MRAKRETRQAPQDQEARVRVQRSTAPHSLQGFSIASQELSHTTHTLQIHRQPKKVQGREGKVGKYKCKLLWKVFRKTVLVKAGVGNVGELATNSF